MATDFAESEAIAALTEEHWKVINYIRNYYVQFGIAPMIRKLCKETGFIAQARFTTCFPPARPREPASWPDCPNLQAASSSP